MKSKLIGIYVIILLTVLVFLFSCTTTKVVTVPEYHTEYVTQTKYDSIYFEKRDSSSTTIKGDTVYQQEWHVKYKDRYICVTDTFIKTDSIRVPYPVERKLSRWEQVKMDYGAVCIGISLAAVIAAAVWLIIWIRRNTSF